MFFRTLLVCAGSLLTVVAYGQSFNIDLDVQSGPPEGGNGAPGASFGAAANQIGFWNRVNCVAPGPVLISDLSGALTAVNLTVSNFGSGGGSGLPINTGDYALLLNDYANIPDQMTYRFSGMALGAYRIYTYAVHAGGETVPVDVTVDGSISGIQTVTGPMPGNSFVQGVTHTIHNVPNLTGDLVIRLAGPWPRAKVNGFQIVAVPEPSTIALLSLGFSCALRRRRGSSRSD